MAHFFKNKFKGKTFVKIFFSFLFVLMIPTFGIYSAIYYTVAHITKEEVTSLNIKILDNVRNTIDSHMSIVNMSVYQLSINPSVLKLVSHTDENSQETVSSIKEILTSLQVTNAQEGVFYLMGIYIPDRNIIISTRNYYDSETFYNYFCNFKDTPSNNFINYIKNTTYSRFLPAMDTQSQLDGTHNVITYVQPLPLNYNKTKAFFIAFIDTNQVQKLLSNDSSFKGNFKISDRQSNTLMLSSNFQVSSSSEFNNNMTDEGYFEVNFEGDKYIAIFNKGKSVNLNYMYYIPEDIILGKLPIIKIISLAIFITCLMVGIVLAYLQSNRYYAPLKGIVNLIQDNVSQNKDSDLNKGEFTIISDTLYDVFNKNAQFKYELQNQFTILKSNFIEKLLYESQLYSDSEFEELLSFYKINFCGSFFQVVIMSFEDIADFNSSSTVPIGNYDSSGILQTAYRFFSDKGYSIHIASLNGQRLAFLINSDMSCNYEFLSTVTQLQELLTIKLDRPIHVGISGVYESIRNINKCYHEATIALNSGQKSGLEKTISYQDAISEISNMYYPLEKEIQIINNVKAGNFEGVHSLLIEIRDVNFRERKLPSEMQRCVFINLISTAFKAYDEIRVDNPGFIDESIKALCLNDKAFKSDDGFNHIVGLFSQACNFASQKMKGKNQRIIARVIEYIQENYNDSNLSLISIADRFNISYYYLSRMFKEETDCNFADFINQYRMEKAQELLSNGKVSIQDVASCVGYTNPNTFIRTFKKQYNITPGQYRKSSEA